MLRTFVLGIALIGSACIAFCQTAKPTETLKYVAIVTRHGVRAPTWTPERLNQYSVAPWPDFGVPPGNLTVHGRELMKVMGSYYHDLFASEGLLGKTDCAEASRTYIWADTDQRTLETARALAEGILPGCKAEIHSVPDGKSDPLFDPIDAGLAKPDGKLALAAVTGSIGPQLDALVDANRAAFDVLTQVLNGSGKAAASIFDAPVSLATSETAVTMNGPLSLASTLTEDFLLEYTTGMRGDQFGWGRLTAAKLQQIMSLHTAYADLMRRTPYLAQARGSNLLSHVVRSIEQAISGKAVKGALGGPGTSLLVVSGHDTNLSNLSGMLNLSWVLPSYQPDDAPPGGALIFSLWQSSTGTFSVRLQFTAQTMDQMNFGTPLSLSTRPATADLFVPGCSEAAIGYACDWSKFAKLANDRIDPAFVDAQ